jgi:hypothetical protein
MNLVINGSSDVSVTDRALLNKYKSEIKYIDDLLENNKHSPIQEPLPLSKNKAITYRFEHSGVKGVIKRNNKQYLVKI